MRENLCRRPELRCCLTDERTYVECAVWKRPPPLPPMRGRQSHRCPFSPPPQRGTCALCSALAAQHRAWEPQPSMPCKCTHSASRKTLSVTFFSLSINRRLKYQPKSEGEVQKYHEIIKVRIGGGSCLSATLFNIYMEDDIVILDTLIKL